MTKLAVGFIVTVVFFLALIGEYYLIRVLTPVYWQWTAAIVAMIFNSFVIVTFWRD